MSQLLQGLLGLSLLLFLAGCDTPERHLVEGNRAYGRGDRKAALVAYQEAARHEQTRVTANLNIGRVLLDEKNFAEAKKYLDDGLAARPDFAQGLLNRAKAELALGQSKEALADLERAVLVEPQTRALWLELGKVRALHGQTEKALEALGKARSAPACQAEATFLSVPLFIQKGQREQAIRELEALIATQPYLPRAYFELGAVLLDLRDFREAERRLRHGLQLEPANRENRLRLARALEGSHRWAEAEREYRAVIAGGQKPDDALAAQAQERLDLATKSGEALPSAIPEASPLP